MAKNFNTTNIQNVLKSIKTNNNNMPSTPYAYQYERYLIGQVMNKL